MQLHGLSRASSKHVGILHLTKCYILRRTNGCCTLSVHVHSPRLSEAVYRVLVFVVADRHGVYDPHMHVLFLVGDVAPSPPLFQTGRCSNANCTLRTVFFGRSLSQHIPTSFRPYFTLEVSPPFPDKTGWDHGTGSLFTRPRPGIPPRGTQVSPSNPDKCAPPPPQGWASWKSPYPSISSAGDEDPHGLQ